MNSSRQLGITLGSSLFIGLLVTGARRSTSTAPSIGKLNAVVWDGAHAAFLLGAVLALAAAVVALTMLPGLASGEPQVGANGRSRAGVMPG